MSFACPETALAVRRLARARAVLGGFDDAGRRTHPGMFDEGVISLAHGEGMRRPQPSVIAAGVRALLDTSRSSIDNYMFLRRLDELDRAISESFAADGIDEATAANVCLDSGTTRLFCGFLYAVASPGDFFLAPRTFYHPLAKWCELSHVRLGIVPTDADNEYKLTRRSVESWIHSHQRDIAAPPRGLIIFNPSMTGAIYTNEELDDLAALAIERDLVVLEDAIFRGTEFDDDVTSPHLAARDGMGERVVTLDGGSKAYSLANIRIGWGCGPKRIIDRMNAYTIATTATVPEIAKLMALASLSAPRSFVRANAHECKERAALLKELVSEVNERVAEETGCKGPVIEILHMPRAGHSMLLSFNTISVARTPAVARFGDSIDVTRYLLSNAKVAVSPGTSTGFNDRTVRASFACVGLDQTYPWTACAESAAVAAVALAELVELSPRNSLARALKAAERIAEETYSSDTNPGFLEGRNLLREALVDRIGPALVQLLKAPEQRRPLKLALAGTH